MTKKKRAVVLISGTGSNLAALLAAQADADYAARVVGVVSDRVDAGGLDIARSHLIPTAVVSPADFADRAMWDVAITKAIDVFQPDVVVSAGFMRILGPAFLDRFEGRAINTHPALLPAFPGAHAVRDALAAGVAETGCTVHLIDAGMDTGPILTQARVAVAPGDTEESLHERIKGTERQLLVETVGNWVTSLT